MLGLESLLTAFCTVPLAAPYRRATLPVVEDAAVLDICFRRAGLTRKDAASRMGMDEHELSRQMTSRGITSARLRLLGADFLAIYAEELSRTVRDTEARLRVVEERTDMLMRFLTQAFQKQISA
jgi:hypothetical protein